jgi:tRNA-Thr(GGU) m(6)t(6)A37 methyltransferase TsaA
VAPLTLEPIGVLRSPWRELAEIPRQPAAARGVQGRVELVKDRHLEDAIADLDSWDHLWLLWWFDRAGGYRPKVLPPRSKTRRGVLATRSPHRPNPIGLSLVRLVAVEAPLTLVVCDVDILDNTPILDIKPYVAYTDCAPTTSSGWLENDPGPRHTVSFTPAALEQLAFLAALGIDLRETIEQRLTLGPEPHAYRRISVHGPRRRLALKSWRVWFHVEEGELVVERIDTGYRARQLEGDDAALEPHRLFVARFGPPSS